MDQSWNGHMEEQMIRNNKKLASQFRKLKYGEIEIVVKEISDRNKNDLPFTKEFVDEATSIFVNALRGMQEIDENAIEEDESEY